MLSVISTGFAHSGTIIFLGGLSRPRAQMLGLSSRICLIPGSFCCLTELRRCELRFRPCHVQPHGLGQGVKPLRELRNRGHFYFAVLPNQDQTGRNSKEKEKPVLLHPSVYPSFFPSAHPSALPSVHTPTLPLLLHSHTACLVPTVSQLPGSEQINTHK